MDEYISKADALDVANSFIHSESIRLGLEQLPAEDVAKIVRCKDCKHWRDVPVSVGFNECAKDYMIRYEDFYCADGERRSNA